MLNMADDSSQSVTPHSLTSEPSASGFSGSDRCQALVAEPDEEEEQEELAEGAHECPVCLQSCVHPVQLPCSHIFCFLCVKGVANHSKKCALCRSEIPSDFLIRPLLLNTDDVLRTRAIDGKYQWFYEGVRGWWQYDARASAEIEDRYQKGDKVFEMLIAGFLYIVDFENMIQYRRNTPSRRRRIKRDLVDIPDKKGVAGLSCRLRPPKRTVGDGGERENGQAGSGVMSGNSDSGVVVSRDGATSDVSQVIGLIQHNFDSLSLADDRIGEDQNGRLNAGMDGSRAVQSRSGAAVSYVGPLIVDSAGGDQRNPGTRGNQQTPGTRGRLQNISQINPLIVNPAGNGQQITVGISQHSTSRVDMQDVNSTGRTVNKTNPDGRTTRSNPTVKPSASRVNQHTSGLKVTGAESSQSIQSAASASQVRSTANPSVTDRGHVMNRVADGEGDVGPSRSRSNLASGFNIQRNRVEVDGSSDSD